MIKYSIRSHYRLCTCRLVAVGSSQIILQKERARPLLLFLNDKKNPDLFVLHILGPYFLKLDLWLQIEREIICDDATATIIDRPESGGVDLIAFFTLVNCISTYHMTVIKYVPNDYNINQSWIFS